MPDRGLTQNGPVVGEGSYEGYPTQVNKVTSVAHYGAGVDGGLGTESTRKNQIKVDEELDLS
jgi:hypothetical protein